MELTQSQQSAFEKARRFFDSKESVFILTGYAGTGKTTLLKALIESLRSSDYPRNVVLMAPTGRAAVILSQKTGYNAATIHRTIFKIEEGAETVDGKLMFALRENNDSEQTVYFVDESSMVSDIPSDNDMFKFGSGCLLNDLMQYCHGRKIVFVGDSAQLPPVGQKESPALDTEYLSQKYNCRVASACLDEVIRQSSESGIYANAALIRKSIENEVFNEFSIIRGDDVRLSSNLFNDYTTEINGCADRNSIIITFSNARALDYNMRIRETLFHNTTERLVAGDLLIISRNNYAHTAELFNGTIVSVAACAADNQLEKRTVRFNVKRKDSKDKTVVKEMELSFRNVTLDIGDGELQKCKILDSFLTDDDGAPGIDISQALHVDFTNRNPKLRRGSKDYFDAIKKDPYMNAVICKYGYAITCHKAQGGEWRNVFIDMTRTQGCRNSDFFRWAYTAVTRSNTNLWIANAPKFDLFSEMQVGTISRGGNVEFYTPSGQNFLDYRFSRIKQICAAKGLNCHENRNIQYQHIIDITDNHGGNCIIQLWYGKNGYKGNEKIAPANPPELATIAKEICIQSLIPEESFVFDDERMERLFAFIETLSANNGLNILNVVNLPFVDRFFMTNGQDYEVVSFTYNAKNQYTMCTLQSSAGTADAALIQFRSQLEEVIQ